MVGAPHTSRQALPKLAAAATALVIAWLVWPESAKATGPLPAPVSSVETEFEGCWATRIDLPWPAGETEGELCLASNASKWEGRFLLKKKWRQLESTRVSADKISFSIDTPVGVAHFDARLRGDTLRGTADGKFGKRPFSAKRK
jgi:hypothetical protein